MYIVMNALSLVWLEPETTQNLCGLRQLLFAVFAGSHRPFRIQ